MGNLQSVSSDIVVNGFVKELLELRVDLVIILRSHHSKPIFPLLLRNGRVLGHL